MEDEIHSPILPSESEKRGREILEVDTPMSAGFLHRMVDRLRYGTGAGLKARGARVNAVNGRRAQLETRTDAELRQLAAALRKASDTNVIECFALAAVAAERVIGTRPFDVQILGALSMQDGRIAEMQTGEGKTLAAVMPVFAQALSGSGAHVWTANDYLAARDAKWMGDIYRFLGLSVGYIGQAMTPAERRAAYACDITYATANEVGFDYLRDQLVLEPEDLVLRPFAFALIDEIDSLLIDEARIPLVIAAEASVPQEIAYTMARLVAGFRMYSDYLLDENRRNVQLTDRGVAKVEVTFRSPNLYDDLRLFTAAQDALHAAALLRRDVDYVVKNNAIELVDEFKGRIARNRRWPAGLQNALEAKEGLALRKQGRILGSITIQSLVGLYPQVCGMTGTAVTQADEFREVYSLEIDVIPTNRPVIRIDQPDIIYADKLAKERALVAEIAKVHVTGRPILVGTASVEESERLSRRVAMAGIPHHVLNARNDEAEAMIVARAGDLGAVTVSTNMAGRGTDIPLGGDEVRELGGLYVLGTNKHESRRIDNQLRGRAGRQGDPGSSRFFVSLHDDLIARYGLDELWSRPSGGAEDPTRMLEHAQRVIESQNLEARKTLWKYEGLIEGHRRDIAERRRRVLFREAGSRTAEGPMSERERRVTLIKIDDLWADYLAAIAELRGGIHWVSWTGKDPLHTFLTGASEIYAEMQRLLEEEIRETLENDAPDREPKDAFDRSATWTYLVNDQPFGTMGDRWAKGVVSQVKALLM
jgi:preprotein translocase subunit SecA